MWHRSLEWKAASDLPAVSTAEQQALRNAFGSTLAEARAADQAEMLRRIREVQAPLVWAGSREARWSLPLSLTIGSMGLLLVPLALLLDWSYKGVGILIAFCAPALVGGTILLLFSRHVLSDIAVQISRRRAVRHGVSFELAMGEVADARSRNQVVRVDVGSD